MSSTETLLKPSAARMPAQTSWRIASIDIVCGQAGGDAQQLLERGAVAGGLGRGEGVLHGLGGVGGQRGEDREVVVGRAQAGVAARRRT